MRFSPSQLKQIREAKHKTLEDFFADLIKGGERISLQSLRNWENGVHEPALEHMQMLSFYLGRPMEAFFDEPILDSQNETPTS